jgi:hypothetical protein
MTALIGGTVERTFSMIANFLTGLPGAKTHEARGQDLGDLGQTAVAGGIHRGCVHRFGPLYSSTDRPQQPFRSPLRIGLSSAAEHGCRLMNLRAPYLPK